ncbi:MAG: hypothetical protein U9N87_01455 [Planctomycetota bacterium]|nr:hypothetical protein [Planctomycetota bacterium]
MNLVGKILTVLIFVMSLCFMMMAVMVYSTHVNWRNKVMLSQSEAGPGQKPGLKFQLQDALSERDDLQAQLQKAEKTLADEQAAKLDQVAKLENECVELRTERDNLSTEIQVLNKSTAEAVAVMERTQATLADLRGEVVNLRKTKRKAEEDRDSSFTKVVEKTDQLHQLQNEKTRLEGIQTTLVADSQRMRDVLRSNDIDPAADPAEFMPKTSGIVSATPGSGIIEINIGSDDGMKKGNTVEIYRTGSGSERYLGRAEIVKTQPDKAVCKIIPEYRKGAILRGDRVTSKL